MKSETIAAIATGMTNAGIGIIRVSGDESISIVNKIYKNVKKMNTLIHAKSHTIHYGFIYDRNELIDEVLVMVMKAPETYTREDTVEINCHGGILVMNRVLETVLKYGARLAEPGEFTKLAFLNGRIDLTQANAVMEVITAKNEYARISSVSQLNGSLADRIMMLRRDIIGEIAFLESGLDDPEHINMDGYREMLYERTEYFLYAINKLITSAETGKLLKEGIQTVIVGKPNAGKSSLLNRLIGEDKAIVTSFAGTTRDVLEESINLNGLMLTIKDTAGICSTQDEIEKIGIEKAKTYALDADLIIYVVDSSIPLDEFDDDIIDLVRDKKMIILLNKKDLLEKVNEDMIIDKFVKKNISVPVMIKTSTKEDTEIDLLSNEIKSMFFQKDISFNDQVYVSNMRQRDWMKQAYDSISLVRKGIEDSMEEDLFSIDLLDAYTYLGYVLGYEVGDDLVDEIFSKFCMGK